jgi:hypothetical protein
MNVKTVKRTERRFETPVVSNLSIQAWGHNNLYPQEILELVSASESASTCIDRYISFVQGNGFKEVNFSEETINALGETSDDIVANISRDLANFRGFSVHVNYNLLGQIVEINHVPFENCRLTEEDFNGYVGKIAVHTDWTGKTKRCGKYLRVSKENIDFIDVFNPIKEVVFEQIKLAGGIENYKGQILWVSEAGKQTYPKPIHDSVVSQMSTEEGLGNIANRNTRNSFFNFGYFITRKSQNTPETEDKTNKDNNSISEALSLLQGDLNTGKMLHFEIEYDEEMPKFERMQGNNYDKDFAITTEKASQKIYSAFNQEVWYRILNGSIGFSSDILTSAYEYYSTVTSKERRMIERMFDKIFKHWYKVVNPSMDFTIQPLKFISSETPNNAG